MAAKKRIVGPDQPALYEEADVFAVQALFTGTANEGQQKRAVKWILEEACQMRGLPWLSGGLEGQRATDFACGRKFAGHQIVKLTEVRLTPKTSGGS